MYTCKRIPNDCCTHTHRYIIHKYLYYLNVIPHPRITIFFYIVLIRNLHARRKNPHILHFHSLFTEQEDIRLKKKKRNRIASRSLENDCFKFQASEEIK